MVVAKNIDFVGDLEVGIFESSVILLNLLAMPREELNYTALDAKEEVLPRRYHC